MNPREAQKEIAFTGMRITHCWEIEPERSAEFAKMFRCEAVIGVSLGERELSSSQQMAISS